MKMSHCLLIFIISLLWVQSQHQLPQSSVYHNGSQKVLWIQDSALDKKGQGQGHDGLLGSERSSTVTVVQFNKALLLIPGSGILLVITMALLYTFYAWNMSTNDAENRASPEDCQIQDHFQDLYGWQCDNAYADRGHEMPQKSTHVANFMENCDSPPSYIEAVESQLPPAYASFPSWTQETETEHQDS